MALMQSDPTNKSVYENNLEAARRTYAKHSENVLKDAAAVNAERKQLLSIAFAGLAVSQVCIHHRRGCASAPSPLACAPPGQVTARRPHIARNNSLHCVPIPTLQLEFFSCAANSLEAVAAAASAAVSNADDHPHDHSPAALWGRMRSEIQKMGHHARQQRAAKVAQRPPQQNKQPSPPPRHQQPQRTATQPPPSDTPQQRGSPDPHARAGGYVPPATQRVPTQEEHDPFGFGTAAPAPPPPRAAASPPPAQEANLFNFGDDSSPASVMAPPTISNESQPEFDLLSGMIGPPQVSHTPSLAVNDLMNDSGASAMDELMSLGAPAALVPETSSHRPRSAASASAVAAHDDFAAFMGGPATVKPQPARASPPFAPEGDLMGGMEDLLGGMGTPELLGGMAGSGAPRSGASLGSGGTERSALGPDGRPLSRQQLAARREAEKAAAIAAKVEEQRTRAATAEQNRETERDLEKVVGARVAQWQRDKKNLRALLASLHEIAPPCSWEPMSLGQLIDPAACKKAYRKAILAVHPDKQDGSDLQKKVLAQHVFDALREAWNVYQKTG